MVTVFCHGERPPASPFDATAAVFDPRLAASIELLIGASLRFVGAAHPADPPAGFDREDRRRPGSWTISASAC